MIEIGVWIEQILNLTSGNLNFEPGWIFFFYTKFDKWEVVTHYEIYDPLNVCFEHIIL